MNKNQIFFSQDNQGLSSTSANYIANLAKEAYASVDEMLNNINFYDVRVKLLDSVAEPYATELGVHSVDFEGSLNYKAELQSLIAWLREALRAKEAIVSDIRNLGVEDIAEKLELYLPVKPERDHILDEDEYIASLSIKERNRYYYLETLCSVLGKFIHPNGAYNVARKKLAEVRQKPNIVSGNGKDTIITTRTPTISQETVDEKFFELQTKHRSYQAELNGMKHKMELAIDASTDAANSKYTQQYAAYREAYNELVAKCEAWREKQLKSARDLKIIIPNDLKSVYEQVAELGKKGKQQYFPN